MAENAILSEAEYASLQEINRGLFQRRIPADHADRLLSLKFIYRLLGDLKITAKGRAVLDSRR